MKPPPPKPAQKFDVLVVEDDLGRAHLLISSLLELNMDCRHAANGSQGLKAFREKMPHLVMTDVMMPGMDGFELCHQMREESTVPIIMMNEVVTDEHQMKALKIGADDYVDKNMNGQVMAAHVIAWLRRVYHYDKSEEVAAPKNQAGGHSTIANAAGAANAGANGGRGMSSMPPSEMARTGGTPTGWVRCEGCGYMGPRQKFAQEGMLDVGGMICPVCRQKDRLVHAVS